MATKLEPFVSRDFRLGRFTPYSFSTYLVPVNSVKNCKNVNFDTIVGSAKVRAGTTLVGAAVASGKSPLGLAEFVIGGGSTNDLLAVFKGASTASIYYYDTSWHTSGVTNLSNTLKCRFAELGGQMFIANGAVMKSSTDGNSWGTTNCITTDSVLPSLLYRFSARLLASGDLTVGAGHSRSRVYFSSIVDPASSPGALTWSTNASTGDWIDVNPDDGGYITGFSETSTFVLVFKNSGMYRLDSVNKSTDPQNIFNIGAVSQEAIVLCQGITYFFSGIDIRQTDGGFPQQISRAGVQDIIDAIPQANWASVASGTDGLNVYFFVGDVTLNANQNGQETITNCGIKFSPRDQSWSVHSYANAFQFFSLFTDSTNGRVMRGADTAGQVQSINVGTTDNTTAINYSLETQDIEFGNRAHLKKMADEVVVFMNNGIDGSFLAKQNGQEKTIQIDLSNRVNIGKSLNLEGNYFNFKWYGECSGTAPVFEGFYIENITDLGTTNK